MPITTSNSAIPHSPNIFFEQTLPAAAGLPNGGYVVAWSDSANQFQNDIRFQIYNGLGEAVGGVQQANSVTAGNQELRDIAVTADGRITMVWSTGATLTARSFDETGAPVSAEQNLTTLNGQALTGVQAIVSSNSAVRMLFTSNNTGATNTIVEQATFNTATGVFGAKATLSSSVAADLSVVDVERGNNSDEFLLLSGTSPVLMASNGSTLALAANTLSVTKLQEDVHLLVTEGVNGILAFSIVQGFSVNIASSVISAQILVTGAGVGNSSQNIHAATTVDLGQGRVLVLWVADTGTGGGGQGDGVYGLVFNTVNASFEGGVQLVLAIPNANLPQATLDAQPMADGRVSLAIGTPTSFGANFNGRDVVSVVVDPRNSGATVTGTARPESFVGSSFGDTFLNISANDVVQGGNGIDTVFLAANAARTIDLADPDRFAAPSNLIGIEIVNLGNLDDVLYGITTSDTVTGGGGNDLLFLRAGADTADGGTGNDTIAGAAGIDNIIGGTGNDILTGGADNDILNGGADLDSVSGGDGNDFILGGDGIDKLYGNAGDDEIDGGAGADFISGGQGNDTILGGADNDTITAGSGDDVIDGGAGGDLINAGTGFNIVDGGTGNDTISYSQVAIAPGQTGVLVDLDPGSDPFGNTDGVTEDDDVLVNFENIFGGDGNDFLFGSGLANVLRGFGGDDTLFGRSNNDVLIGGTGNDRFVYDSPATAGGDQIRDFTAGADEIVIVSAAFGNIHLGNIGASFVSNADATPAANGNPQFLFDNAGSGAGRLFFDSNGNTAGGATLIATLTFTAASGLASFNASDFAFL